MIWGRWVRILDGDVFVDFHAYLEKTFPLV